MRMLWYWPFARPEEMDLARAVAGFGHHVTVVVVDREGAPVATRDDETTGLVVARVLPDVDRDAEAGPAWVWSRARTYLRRSSIRRRMLRDGRFDLVHYHYLNRFTDAWRRPRGLWIVSVHDVVPHQPRLGRLERRLLWFLYRRPDGLIVHHEWLRTALGEQFGVPRARVRVVPLQVCSVDEPRARTRGDEQPMVLLFGALRENKGLEVLLSAASRLGGDTRVHIAGRGARRLEQLAIEAAAANPNIIAEIGRINDARKAELFRACAVVALPYTSFSSQSGVLHDAYGHHRPVVVTDVGALGSTVRADGTGLVVPPGNANLLADALVRMCGPEGDTAADAARRIAEQRSASATAVKTIEAYEYFANERG